VRLLGREVIDFQGVAILEIGYRFSVGRELRLKFFGRGGDNWFFLHHGRYAEIGLFFPGDRRCIDVPVIVLFGCVDQRATVGAKADAPFLIRRIRDSLNHLAVEAADKDLAPKDKCEFLSIRRQFRFGKSAIYRSNFLDRITAVGADSYTKLCW